MAIFTTAITTPDVNGYGLDMFSYNVGDLNTYADVTTSTTQVRFFDDADNEEVFTGVGFTFDTGGQITGGTITGYVLRVNGVVAASFTALNVAAAPVGAAIAANDTFLFLSLLSAGGDTMTGSALRDNLYFGDNAGVDTINGLAGGDYIYGGSGADTINGGVDNDFLVGGAGNDTIDGGTGGDDFDTLGYSDEYIFFGGTQGITVNLSGVTQGGLLTGRAIDSYGNTDTISNFEEVQGTSFADTVYAAALANNERFHFKGFAGNDIFVGTSSARDRISYVDDQRYAVDVFNQRGIVLTATGITVNFASDVVAGNGASGTVTDSFGFTDTVSGVDGVRATFFADTLNGGADNEQFQGLKGADIINGGGGFDVSDYYNDRWDNGVQAGGLAGITANFSGDILANGIAVGTVVDGFGTTDQLTNIEAIDGTDFADTMTGGVDRVEFWANGGDDTLTGGSADDELQGGDGTDTIHGGAGNDNIRGDEGGNVGQGNDQLFGEAGDDSFKGGAGNDLINGGADRDRVEYNLETTFTGDDATHGVIVNLSNAALLNVTVAGIALTNVASGTAVDTRNYVDTLVSIEDVQGTGYDDIIVTDIGDNSIAGNSGADVLRTGLDSDWISGGAGNDVMDGGTGGDDFDTLGYIEEYVWQSGTQGITVNLSGVTQAGLLTGRAIDAFGNTDTIANFEDVRGTGFADTVYSAVLLNQEFFNFQGFVGNDTFVGSSGRDRIDYRDDARDAADANSSRGLNLVAQGITVNFAGDVVAGNGASGTVTDSFGGTDTVAGVNSVRATFFVDTINGGADDEEFRGLKGADIINGGGGFDVSSYSNDRNGNGLQAGGLAGITVNFSGDILANGISVGTVIDGFGTTDQLTNIEAIDGTDFNDSFTGGADRVEFWSGSGQDSFVGGNADDYADGGADSDNLNGGAGNDVLRGGAGADTLNGGSNSGAGDTLDYENSQFGISINLALNTAQGGDAQGDIISNFENVTGTAFGDQLTGDGGNNILQGGAGNDLFVGGLGADTMIGGADLDVVDYSAFTIGVSVNLTTGTGPGGDIISEIENIIGSAFGDVLDGNNGANTMRGGGGNDFLVAGNGADLLIGGADNDVVSYETATTGVFVNLTTGVGANGGVLQEIENITGSAFGDVMQGDNGANTIRGGAGNDFIIAGNGADYLIGGADNDVVSYETATLGVFANLASGIGANGGVLQEIENLTGSNFGDVLLGSAGGNTLRGGAGNDYLVGDAGSDALYGGADNDVFRFETTSFGNDVIGDFEDNGDKLSFAAAVATNFSQFTILNNNTTNVTVQIAGQSIVVQGVANISLTVSDFLFV